MTKIWKLKLRIEEEENVYEEWEQVEADSHE